LLDLNTLMILNWLSSYCQANEIQQKVQDQCAEPDQAPTEVDQVPRPVFLYF